MQQPRSDAYHSLPAEPVTIDQVVAVNMRHWRREAGITQEELGKRIGWSAANVSAAERSASENRERRRFDAHTLVLIAHALGVPLPALFLPPGDDGLGRRYIYESPAGPRDMTALLDRALTDNDDESTVMDAYRDRVYAVVHRYRDEDWAEETAKWLRPLDSAEMRADRASRLRSGGAAILAWVTEMNELADALERPDPGEPS